MSPDALYHLHQLVEYDGVEAGQVLHVVSLHDGAVLPHVGSQLLHVEDELGNVSARPKGHA